MDKEAIKINIIYMEIRKFTIIGIFLFLSSLLHAQTLTLEEAQEKAAAHYPALARFNIIEQTKEYNLANASTAYLPQVSLHAQATWQSDVTKIELEVPGIDIPTPDKDQYKIIAELNQLIWDGGKIAAQKESISANAEVEKQQLESEIYSLRERVNGVYFGALLLKEQLEQQENLENELQRNHDKVQSYIRNGVANEADLSAVKVEQLKAKQQRTQLESALTAYLQMLSVFTGEKIDNEVVLVKPQLQQILSEPFIQRPELKLFDAQENLLDAQKNLIRSKNMPVLGAFAQGGYGKPALNMFDNSFSPYFLGGIRLSWNLANLYTAKNERRNIDLQKMAIDSQRETFLYNLNLQMLQQQNEIDKFYKTMQDDDEIIRLREVIKNAVEVKLENGTMTVTDMLKEINELEMAKQTKALHEIQYLLSIYNLKNTTN